MRHAAAVLALMAMSPVLAHLPAQSIATLVTKEAQASQTPAPLMTGDVSPAEAALRNAIAAGDSTRALAAVNDLPKDALLRQLHIGLIYHRAGAFAASNRALQAAEAMAEERYTKSLRQVLGAAVINETVSDYNPPAHERAFIHYYGMLNYLSLGNLDDALVEARKANQFLERYARDNGARTFTTDAAVEYLAGLLHQSGGDNNDAMVSLQKAMGAFDTYSQRYGVPRPKLVGIDAARVATRMGSADVAREIADRYELSAAEARPPAGSGELLVLVENGFVAHRVQEKLYVALLGTEVSALANGGIEAAVLVGLPIVDRITTLFQESSRGDEYAQHYSDGYVVGSLVSGGEVISMAWPRYSLQANAVDDVTVSIGTQRQAALVMDDLSAIAARSFEEEKSRIMRRAVFRAAGKFAVSKYAEAKAKAAAGGGFSLKGLAAGYGAKALVQGVGNATEVADIRSWSTLPAEIRTARFSLPPGEHHVTLTMLDGNGARRELDLGTVTIVAGKLAVRSAFVTGTSRGALARFEKARSGADVAAGAAVATGVPIAAPVASAQSAPVPLPATLASVIAARPLGASFKPLGNEVMRFALQLRGTPESEKRARAELSAYVTKQGTTDTVLVWNGGEGDTLAWGGRLGNALAPAGLYTWIVRTTTPRGDKPTQYTWTTTVDVDAPNGIAVAPEPAAPQYESETRTVREPNYAKKGRLMRHGLVWGVIGSVFTTVGYSMAVKAVASTPPGSGGRSTALAVWGTGAAGIGIGGLMVTSGALGQFPHDVQLPDPGAKVRNEDARRAHDAAVASVRAKNERIRNSAVMRVRIGGAAPGKRP